MLTLTPNMASALFYSYSLRHLSLFLSQGGCEDPEDTLVKMCI